MNQSAPLELQPRSVQTANSMTSKLLINLPCTTTSSTKRPPKRMKNIEKWRKKNIEIFISRYNFDVHGGTGIYLWQETPMPIVESEGKLVQTFGQIELLH